MRRGVAIIVGLVLLATACADDDQPGVAADESEALRTLIAEDLVASQQEGAIGFDEPQAACTADGFVERFGAEQLRAWGYDEETGQTPEGDLTIADEELRVDAWGILRDCVDVTDQITVILADSGGLDDEQARCVAQRYVDSEIAAHAVFGPADPEVNDAVDELLEDAVADCS